MATTASSRPCFSRGMTSRGSRSASSALKEAGHPVVRFHLSDRYDLGRRDVPLGSGDRRGRRRAGAQPLRPAGRSTRQGAVGQGHEGRPSRGHPAAAERWAPRIPPPSPPRWPTGCAGPRPGTISASMPISPRRPARPRCCTPSRPLLHEKTRLAVTLGYGPRFLHSTGQLHKGGPDRCRFLQFVDEPARGPARAGDPLHLRNLDPRPGGWGPSSSGAAGADGVAGSAWEGGGSGVVSIASGCGGGVLKGPLILAGDVGGTKSNLGLFETVDGACACSVPPSTAVPTFLA